MTRKPKKRSAVNPDQGSMFGSAGQLAPTPPKAGAYSLYGGTPPHQKSSATSASAAESVRGVAGKMQAAVLACIAGDPNGLTCDAVEEKLDGRHQSISARVRELFLLGLLRKSGTRRTRSGRKAVVYATTGKAKDYGTSH